MNCPFCGKKLKDGRVFCENCGKEIQMVPVFEPEIEEKMQRSLNSVLEVFNDETVSEELAETENNAESTGEDNEPSYETKQKKKYRQLAQIIVMCVVLVFMVIIAVVTMNSHSYDYQMKKAQEAYDASNYEAVLKYAQKAAAIAPNSSDAKMLLAECSQKLGRGFEAKEILENLIKNDNSYVAAYKSLIAIYEEEASYEKINELLKACKDASIISEFQAYTAFAPQFSEEEGEYDSILVLKLLAGSHGKVYYTTDGTIPDENSEEYMAPFLLEQGKHTISAVYMNQYGVSSEVVTKYYDIDISKPDEPEITVESGTYQVPQMIETTLPNDFEIYYTTDGSEPTRNSNPYLVPIPMPLGQSVFKFILYSDEGVAGNVATREYNLELDTTLTTDTALIILKQALILNGSILDMQGNVAGSTTRKEYEIKSAFTEDDQIFYLIVEYAVEPDGIRAKTGNHYAVNIATGELYKASANYAGYFMVEAFE